MTTSAAAASAAAGGALFRLTTSAGTETLYPLPASASGWSGDQIRGLAVSGALARATERTAHRDLAGMRVTRWSVDLFRPARVRPTTVTTTVLRQGRRVGVIDAMLLQDNRPVARSRALLARPSAAPPGDLWRPEQCAPTPPPADLEPVDGENRLYYSQRQGWNADADTHHNDSRKQLWHLPVELVLDEDTTAFQLVAAIADLASLVVHWGTAGVQYINADIDLVLFRDPTSAEVGLSATDHVQADGIATGTAAVFDRAGLLGRASVVAVANPVSGVDPANRRPDLSAFTSTFTGTP